MTTKHGGMPLLLPAPSAEQPPVEAPAPSILTPLWRVMVGVEGTYDVESLLIESGTPMRATREAHAAYRAYGERRPVHVLQVVPPLNSASDL